MRPEEKGRGGRRGGGAGQEEGWQDKEGQAMRELVRCGGVWWSEVSGAVCNMLCGAWFMDGEDIPG